jgi:ABC-2 type transport system ATP-binding protein
MPAISFQTSQDLHRRAARARAGRRQLRHRARRVLRPARPNGAGKTTLISILAGLARATQRQVSVLGHDVVDDYARRARSLGIVPQELVFDPFFTVREALRIQSGYFGVRDNDAWIDELLAASAWPTRPNANMRQLSGGMKRRVLVAQALVHRRR